MTTDIVTTMVRVFENGARVEARISSGIWVEAVIESHSPYHHRGRLITDGYYVRYPAAREQWECHGGWKPINCLRAAAQRRVS